MPRHPKIPSPAGLSQAWIWGFRDLMILVPLAASEPSGPVDAGNLMPPDRRFHWSVRLRVNGSTHRGESVTVQKSHHALPQTDDGTGHPAGDRNHAACKGTLVIHGRAGRLVVDTGTATEPGPVAGLPCRTLLRAAQLQQRPAAFGRCLSQPRAPQSGMPHGPARQGGWAAAAGPRPWREVRMHQIQRPCILR